MEWVNITAKSVPEAIDLALDNLGVDESEAEIEVLEEPKQGLFGRVRGTARVRARVKPKGTRPKVERGRTRRRRPEGETATTSGGSRGTGGGRSRAESGTKTEEAPAGDEAEENTAEVAAAAPRSSSQPRGGRSSSGRSRSESGSGGGRSRSGGSDRQNREPVEEASVEEVSAQLEAFLSGLSEAFGFEGKASVGPADDDGLLGMVEGRHGVMVGPRARTLDAIQELARVSVQRTAPSSIRIKVDVGGYREVRREALRQFALDAAAAVRADGRERSLEPMSSADRKIVHDTLSEEAGVETRSAGSEPSRRVVVMAAQGTADDSADEVDASTNGHEANGSTVAASADAESNSTQAVDNAGDEVAASVDSDAGSDDDAPVEVGDES